jgi:hypothetical protein
MKATEVADDLLAQGWAAPATLDPGPRDLPAAVAAALPEAMIRRLAANVELGRQLALAERDRDAARSERDEALKAAHRYETASIRLDVDNRALRERLEALQRANEGRRRRWPRRRRPVADGGACVCLSQVRWQR